MSTECPTFRVLCPVPVPPWSSIQATAAFLDSGAWPAKWIRPRELAVPGMFLARLVVELVQDASIRLYLSADDRCEFVVDGQAVFRGPHRSDRDFWPYACVELDLAAGRHVLVARVCVFGDAGPSGSVGRGSGLIVASADPAHSAKFNTGQAAWEVSPIPGITWLSPNWAWGTGAKVEMDATNYPGDWMHGAWPFVESSPETGPTGSGPTGMGLSLGDPRLVPAVLPPMLEKPFTSLEVVAAQWLDCSEQRMDAWEASSGDGRLAEDTSQLLRGAGALCIPSGRMARILIHTGDYVCAYPIVEARGLGGSISLCWAESLYDAPSSWGDHGEKGMRNHWAGKYFPLCNPGPHGVGDRFLTSDRPCRFDPPLWQCGRWIELFVRAGEEDLEIGCLRLVETRYPLELTPMPGFRDERWRRLWPILVRTLLVDAHETYFDCPYYEQLMYAGDTRLQILITYLISHDDRLPRHAIRLFSSSLTADGITQSRYPSRQRQIIPPFGLAYIGMVRDFAWWRRDPEEVERLFPAVVSVVEAFRRCVGSDGLVVSPPGWNFVDWVSQWHTGQAPADDAGRSGLLTAYFLLGLREAADVALAIGRKGFAADCRDLAERCAAGMNSLCWDEERGLYTDVPGRPVFSEHAQCLMILSGAVPSPRAGRVMSGLNREDADVARTTIYFTHYLFEVCGLLGMSDLARRRMELWFGLADLGFATAPEAPEPSRSDCHAWSSHPIHHLVATFCGVRPSQPGFRAWEVRPLGGFGSELRMVIPHPDGELRIEARQRSGENPRVDVQLAPSSR